MAKHLFQPGQSGNPNGKPKGSKNKTATRERIQQHFENPATWARLMRELDSLSGKAYVESHIKLLEYLIPKFQSMHLSLSNMPPADLQFLLTKLKENGPETEPD
jgi:hypothetical protein